MKIILLLLLLLTLISCRDPQPDIRFTYDDIVYLRHREKIESSKVYDKFNRVISYKEVWYKGEYNTITDELKVVRIDTMSIWVDYGDKIPEGIEWWKDIKGNFYKMDSVKGE